MKLGLLSAKSSPGVTTLGMALASYWAESAVLLEMDPSGGDLSSWMGIGGKSGGLSLAGALASSHDLSETELLEHGWKHCSGTRVISMPTGGGAVGAINEIHRRGDRLNAPKLIMDFGRWGQNQPSADRLKLCERHLLMLQPDLAGVQHAKQRLEQLAEIGLEPELVTLGTSPYSPAEIAKVLSVPVLGAVANDWRSAQAVAAGRDDRMLRRSPMFRSIASIAFLLDDQLVGA